MFLYNIVLEQMSYKNLTLFIVVTYRIEFRYSRILCKPMNPYDYAMKLHQIFKLNSLIYLKMNSHLA